MTRFRLSFPIVLVGLLSIPACSLLGSETDAPTGLLPFETLLQSQEFIEADKQTFVVLSSQHEEAAFLSSYEQHEPFPEVNYSNKVAVGLLTGWRPNTSYSVRIDSLVASPEAVYVYATETGSSLGGRAITHPAHVVILSRSELRGRSVELADIRRICERSPCAWE